MYRTITKSSWRSSRTAVGAAVAILVPLSFVYLLPMEVPAWELMWFTAIAIYCGAKWLTFVSCPAARHVSAPRALAYLLLWPGMNAAAFLGGRSQVARPALGEWRLAIFNFVIGLELLQAVSIQSLDSRPLVAAWIGMIGLVFVLHFGVFHLLSLGWRLAGIKAEPIMNFPILAHSISDFWGRRWNSAFRDLAFGQVFRPLARHIGAARATLAVFTLSGLIHDFVISAPVDSGWGGPTVYFVIQGFGLLLERSDFGQRLGLGNGIRGRLICGLFVLGPIGLLFHEPFLRFAVVPTLAALGVA